MRPHRFRLAQLLLIAFFALPRAASAEDCRPASFDGAFAGEVTLCQNWDAGEQQEFWFLSQGSQIIPYAWFLALEQADSGSLFHDPVHMDAFRYLPQAATAMNPDALPIGFTRDSAAGNENYEAISEDWLGLTCAACHTGQVEFEGAKILIDGAPTMADFEGFMTSLVDAMQATLDDPDKLARFHARVAAQDPDSDDSVRALEKELRTVTEIRRDWNQRNKGDHPYGFARLDAIGAIFNEVAATGTGQPGNAQSANAPVSYPFIWDTPQHDRVQWNGSVANKGFGALGRNVGEVLGVFGALELGELGDGKIGNASSVEVRHLGELEALIWKLQSPLWPEAMLTAIDRGEVTQTLGRETFERHCLSCHADILRDDPNREVEAVMTPVRPELLTDSMMADNFLQRRYPTGRLRREFKRVIPRIGGDRFGEEALGVEFLGYGVVGTIVNKLAKDPFGTIEALKAGRPPLEQRLISELEDSIGTGFSSRKILRAVGRFLERVGGDDDAPPGRAYKARPLNGIWATAPYLHNGSVRTMRQLLLPAEDRQTEFRVGSREYDPEAMGFVDEGGFLFDTTLPGNSNAGHEYGAFELKAKPETLEALLEYLKTL